MDCVPDRFVLSSIIPPPSSVTASNSGLTVTQCSQSQSNHYRTLQKPELWALCVNLCPQLCGTLTDLQNSSTARLKESTEQYMTTKPCCTSLSEIASY